MISTVPEGLKRDAKRPRAWREARLVCVDDPERTRRQYGLSFEPVDHSTAQWGHCARLVGRAQSTRMYIVADEANWIERICAQTFGDDARLLVDFYHVSEYLVDASHARRPSKPKQWLQTQQKRLKRGQYRKVIQELAPHVEDSRVADEQAPIRSAHRYLTNRQDQLFYDEALAEKLPIGSGIVESGNRHVVQDRLKLPVASWLVSNAHAMARIRTTQANGAWEEYWASLAA